MRFSYRYCLFVLFIIFSLNGSVPQKKNIVFDLDGVLVTASHGKIFKHLGMGATFKYVFFDHKNPARLGTRLFNLLDEALPYPDDPAIPFATGENGNRMAHLLYQHLKGDRTSVKILDDAHMIVEKSTGSKREKNLLHKLTDSIFDPKLFSSFIVPLKEGIKLFEDCYMQGHDLYILSNWDKESFELLEREFPELFILCKGIIISGEVNMVKPDVKIFEKLLADFNLYAQDTIFIDDREENKKAAEKAGITGILCDNHKNVRKQLETKKVLRAPK